jgi:molybdopterin biosynthesis enzyme
VAPFLPHRVGMVVSEDLDARARGRFERSIGDRLAWFGAELLGVRYVEGDGEGAAAAVRALLNDEATLILTGGGNAIDPADPMLRALNELGVPLEKHGVPAHPGSMLWLAYVGETPMLGLPSCGMYSRATAMDIVLPQLLTGRKLRRADLAALGHGGHLTRSMEFRFAPYEPGA